MKKRFSAVLSVAAALSLLALAPSARATSSSYQAEVLSVTGNAYSYSTAGTKRGLLDGDVLREGDSIETTEGATVEIALDGDWKNVLTIEENTQILIDTLYPTSIQMTEGDVYAKLDDLPKESSFEVRTPVLIASVRGTVYRTRYQEGDSQVYSYSDSPVYVYGRDKNGTPMSDPVILKNKETTVAAHRGDFPEVPYHMSETDFERHKRYQSHIELSKQRAVKEGRRTKIQPLVQIKRDWQQRDKLRRDERQKQGSNGPGGPGGPGSGSGGASRGGSSIQLPRDRFFSAVDAPTPKSQFDIDLENEERLEQQKERERKDLGRPSLGHGTAPPGSDPFARKGQGPGSPLGPGKPGQPGQPGQNIQGPDGPGGPGQGPGQPGKKQPQGARRPPPPRGGQK